MTEWVTKVINTGACTKEIRSLTHHDKISDMMYNVSHMGREIQKLSDAGKSVGDYIQKYAADNMPVAEELLSACG